MLMSNNIGQKLSILLDSNIELCNISYLNFIISNLVLTLCQLHSKNNIYKKRILKHEYK